MTIDKLTGRRIKVVTKAKAIFKPKKKKEKLPKTYVVMVLDKSGSMWSSMDQARNHFNEQVQIIKDSTKEQDISVSLCMFNQDLDYKYFNKDLNSLKQLTDIDYYPRGMTALYDAIGCTVNKMQRELKDLGEDHVSVLFFIITDGLENRSKVFPGDFGRRQVKTMMQELQATGRWTFTYMGTEHNVERVALDLAIPLDNTMQFERTAFVAATHRTTEATNDYFKSRKIGKKNSDQFYDKKI
jgi:uncharacterized protein YegL